ncbi:hypothetical protein [Bacillus sp. UNCCL13]|nr:hypothetical protein [Bacillus sp. UNCCL13]
MDKIIAFCKLLFEPPLLLYIYSPLLGVLIGVYITYKLTIDRDRITVANNTYITAYRFIYIKLSTIKINIDIKKKELGNKNFRKLNKQSKKTKNITLVSKHILDVSDEIHKLIKKQNQDNLSMVVISRYFALEQIKEQIRMAEISVLGIDEDKNIRESRIARLYYELACTKILFVQGILEDMQKMSKAARIKDKEMKTTIKFLIKTCRNAKKKGVSKMYGIDIPKHLKLYNLENKSVG